jgi:hypothetical protein
MHLVPGSCRNYLERDRDVPSADGPVHRCAVHCNSDHGSQSGMPGAWTSPWGTATCIDPSGVKISSDPRIASTEAGMECAPVLSSSPESLRCCALSIEQMSCPDQFYCNCRCSSAFLATGAMQPGLHHPQLQHLLLMLGSQAVQCRGMVTASCRRH